jgi:hypothetical protein
MPSEKSSGYTKLFDFSKKLSGRFEVGQYKTLPYFYMPLHFRDLTRHNKTLPDTFVPLSLARAVLFDHARRAFSRDIQACGWFLKLRKQLMVRRGTNLWNEEPTYNTQRFGSCEIWVLRAEPGTVWV